MRSVKCVNANNNFSLTFSEDAFQPFILASAEGLYSSKNKVNLSENTMTDGSTYQGSIAEKRNIVLYVMDNPQSSNFVYDQYNRDVLYSLFRRNEQGTLYYTENDKTRKINYYVESINRANKGSRLFSISLICPYPLFQDVTPNSSEMANWMPNFEFVHEFLEEGEELGYKSNVRLINIINDTAAEGTGLTIEIDATGSASNVTISHIELDEHITVGTSGKPFSMVNGDKLVITTSTNNKHVKLIRDGVITEVNEYLSEDSEFIQMIRGNNNIAYSASSGEQYLSVKISYIFEYEGA